MPESEIRVETSRVFMVGNFSGSILPARTGFSSSRQEDDMMPMPTAMSSSRSTGSLRTSVEFVLEEPEFVEVDSEADVEVVFLKQGLGGALTVAEVESEMKDCFG